jgi:hypothetical protein
LLPSSRPRHDAACSYDSRAVVLKDRGNRAILAEDDLLNLEGGLDGVGLIIDPFELLQCAAVGFDTAKIFSYVSECDKI